MPFDEYASQGFLAIGNSQPIVWGASPPPGCGTNFSCNVGDAVEAAGSLRTVIGGGGGGFEIQFLTAVHSFGFGVVQDEFVVGKDRAVTIRAFDDQDNVLGLVSLWDDLIDGGFHEFEEQFRISFGFLGLSSKTAIARLEFINSSFSSFDDFHFSSEIPAPGGVAVMVGGVGLLGLRRRRA